MGSQFHDWVDYNGASFSKRKVHRSFFNISEKKIRDFSENKTAVIQSNKNRQKLTIDLHFVSFGSKTITCYTSHVSFPVRHPLLLTKLFPAKSDCYPSYLGRFFFERGIFGVKELKD